MSASWYVGGETDYYTPGEMDPCPCQEAGLVECWCGGEMSLQDARDWLEGQGVASEEMHAVDVILAVEERHPDGAEGLYNEVAADKASARLRGPDYSGIVGRAA